MRSMKYSDSTIENIKEQKKTMTAKQVAEKNNMTVSQVNYIIYSAVTRTRRNDIPEFLREDEKKFKELYKPKPELDLGKPEKRSFLDWLLGR
jgi:hypothetical protein|tara:strand:- start:2260 stop:2535 length:276 start_codon:yes stop_codon:yes gene_type:complete